jgi:hypothetical protein
LLLLLSSSKEQLIYQFAMSFKDYLSFFINFLKLLVERTCVMWSLTAILLKNFTLLLNLWHYEYMFIHLYRTGFYSWCNLNDWLHGEYYTVYSLISQWYVNQRRFVLIRCGWLKNYLY